MSQFVLQISTFAFLKIDYKILEAKLKHCLLKVCSRVNDLAYRIFQKVLNC